MPPAYPLATQMALRCGVAVMLLTAGASQAQSALPQPVVQALQETGFDAAHLSALVVPALGGAPKLAHLESRPMSPASTMKLVTTLVALEELGPTYRWTTRLLAEKPIHGSTLKGPLYLQGQGDPNFTWDAMRDMLRNLRDQGVRRLQGDLVLDRHYFRPARPDAAVPDFDESPQAYYNVIPDALLLNGSLLSLALHSDGKQTTIRTGPDLAGARVRAKIELDDSACEKWDDDLIKASAQLTDKAGLELTIAGSFPRNCKSDTQLNVLDRNDYIARFVRTYWKEIGGSWTGAVRDGVAPADAKLLVTHRSDTLATVVRLINKPSDNAMTRSVFMTLGEQRPPEARAGSSTQSGALAIRAWFARKGLSDAGLVLDNGSGLSRIERISAQQMAGLLQAGARSPWYAEFASSLPIVGTDGTMRRRLKDVVAPGRARIKTGTLRDTTAIAGYVRDPQDREWVVVAFVNADNAVRSRPVLDALIHWVASEPSAP
ncbi:MAG: D-alanyl-D-alanine carboxypeptidase/D-alanyl-D-alanine-endopeptidase [Rhodoferax sp.]|nr:D-alanyl-D-alanine carboxypeptidase/D-alanyl-D-alanine-endopeptidase [Rhodoferax sp.]